MARVNFYVLPAADEQSRRQFACRLAEKAYKLENSVRILAADRDTAEQLDDLLWTWRDGSFVPHEVLERGAIPQAPVTIGYDDADEGTSDLLINLRDGLPAQPEKFPRIAEIVTSDDVQRRLGRERYSRYREQGHALETHKL